MGLINVTRLRSRHKKRDVSVAALEIDGAEIGGHITGNPFIANTDDFELAVLPTFIFIVSVNTIVIESFDALLTVDLGFAGGTGIELDGAVALDGAADTVIAGNAGISIQTGPTVIADFSATPTQGKAIVLIEYIEYNQASGELTAFSDTSLSPSS